MTDSIHTTNADTIIAVPANIPRKEVLLKSNHRTCGDCTKCCDGSLSGVAHGIRFYRGKPCHFKCETGCGIYKDRPQSPCIDYTCGWLDDKDFAVPEWMKPSVSNVILDIHPWGEKDSGKAYLRVTEAGAKMDPKVMWWVFAFTQANRLSFGIQIGGGWNYYGDQEFIDFIEKEE